MHVLHVETPLGIGLDLLADGSEDCRFRPVWYRCAGPKTNLAGDHVEESHPLNKKEVDAEHDVPMVLDDEVRRQWYDGQCGNVW